MQVISVNDALREFASRYGVTFGDTFRPSDASSPTILEALEQLRLATTEALDRIPESRHETFTVAITTGTSKYDLIGERAGDEKPTLRDRRFLRAWITVAPSDVRPVEYIDHTDLLRWHPDWDTNNHQGVPEYFTLIPEESEIEDIATIPAGAGIKIGVFPQPQASYTMKVLAEGDPPLYAVPSDDVHFLNDVRINVGDFFDTADFLNNWIDRPRNIHVSRGVAGNNDFTLKVTFVNPDFALLTSTYNDWATNPVWNTAGPAIELLKIENLSTSVEDCEEVEVGISTVNTSFVGDAVTTNLILPGRWGLTIPPLYLCWQKALADGDARAGKFESDYRRALDEYADSLQPPQEEVYLFGRGPHGTKERVPDIRFNRNRGLGRNLAFWR